jgi:hypothetical protein
MRLPAFTASSVLPAPVPSFRATSDPRAPRAGIRPAAAIYVDGRFVCYGEVTGSGYINCYPPGGGGSPRCRPACSPCQPDSDSPTGRSRFCIRANCDDYSRPC